MKRMPIITAILAIILPFTPVKAQDPEGALVYALPKTVINLEVEAVRENFHAGPYAKYAKKYLGIDVRQTDGQTSRLNAVKLSAVTEADQTSRYTVTPGKSMPAFLALTAQGLISTGNGLSGDNMAWQFADDEKGDFSGKGVSSNFTSETTTLYRNVNGASQSIRQEMIVEKTSEDKAKEAAEMIFKLRKMRVQIVTGDTDATYSGEAMPAVLAELTRLEKEYLSLFAGYSDYSTQKTTFAVIPEKGTEAARYIAFRVSDSEGLVDAENISGKPYVLEIVPEPVANPDASAASKSNAARYRIPAICSIKLRDGVSVILQTRIPVYQMGRDSSFPLK